MADLYRFRLGLQFQAGNPLVSTYYFDTITGDLGDAATAIYNLWDDLSPLLASALTWQLENEVAVINAADGSLVGYEHTSGSLVGGGSSDANPLPWATQGLIRWKSSSIVNGQQVTGRTFIPGLTEDASTSGVPLSATVTSIAAAVTTYLTGLNGFCIWSRPVPSGPHTRTGSEAPVTGAQVWNQFAVLRSRRN
jgi:hypothetical protein